MATFFGGLGYVVDHALNYGTVPVALASILVLYRVLFWGGGGRSIRHVPGPPCPSWIFGNMQQLLLSSTYGEYEFRWQKLYGPVYRLKGCFESFDGLRSSIFADMLYLSVGEKNVMLANDHDHKRLRAALNVGFTAAAVRNYLPVLEKVAQTLAEQLEEISEVPTDICPLLSVATLCAISEVALGYTAKDLGEEYMLRNSQVAVLVSFTQSSFQILAEAISALLPTPVRRAVIYLPTQTFKVIRAITRLTDALGKQVVSEKKDAARQGLDIGTDLYGQLLKQGHSGKNALTEEELAGQTAILLANTLAFSLLELARAPDLQEKLRAEIHSMVWAIGKTQWTNGLVSQESLRMYPAAPIAERIAVRDTVIPLGDHITNSTGEILSQIYVRKGQIVAIGIAAYQQQESRWGEHPHEFNPSRWLTGMTTQGEALGPHANLLSFLGGPRACLGWRLALLEMQVFICEVVGKFSLTLPEDHSVCPRFASSLMPTMPDGTKGAPLCIKRIV
ncbi:cytochrome P450 [Mycena leptocephala]|nr:cytochrome P450 [Mycena leptocephala]